MLWLYGNEETSVATVDVIFVVLLLRFSIVYFRAGGRGQGIMLG